MRGPFPALHRTPGARPTTRRELVTTRPYSQPGPEGAMTRPWPLFPVAVIVMDVAKPPS